MAILYELCQKKKSKYNVIPELQHQSMMGKSKCRRSFISSNANIKTAVNKLCSDLQKRNKSVSEFS